jgi:hypothetical protein
MFGMYAIYNGRLFTVTLVQMKGSSNIADILAACRAANRKTHATIATTTTANLQPTPMRPTPSLPPLHPTSVNDKNMPVAIE